MDHAFIDRYAVADRYVKRTLPADERAAFEAHLVDCQECADRVLLATMLRDGKAKPIRVETPPRPAEPPPAKGSSVSSAQLWKLALLFAAGAAALLAIPTAVFLWQLHRLR
ncbi:MAG TPA: zf-HC2 domain-containing protein [Bryobacteraceae bacterium]|nr:zf-HC2 domain-containing protein [Bryobacteraceae bacterium]